jgi:phosphoesterase RecJ-like protein
LENILKIINEHDNFVLSGHIGPDGDAIGSCFSLALALSQMGKQARVVLDSYSQKYNIIPGHGFLYTKDFEALNPEVFIAMDCADISRLSETARTLFERTEITICVDHHETNTGFAMHNYIEPNASSTAEMTFNLIEQLTSITPDMATAIYAGMVSDTGGFKYNATAKSTMETAAHLMELIPFTTIYNEVLHYHRFAAGKAMGLAMENAKRTRSKKIVYTYLTREMLKSVRASDGDVDGIVEYLMGTRKALAAFFIYEKKGDPSRVKVSLRSHGPNVGRVALQLGGGGHVLAAGALVEGTLEKVLKRTLGLVKHEVNLFV